MAYNYERRNQLAECKLLLGGVPRDPNVSPYTTWRNLPSEQRVALNALLRTPENKNAVTPSRIEETLARLQTKGTKAHTDLSPPDHEAITHDDGQVFHLQDGSILVTGMNPDLHLDWLQQAAQDKRLQVRAKFASVGRLTGTGGIQSDPSSIGQPFGGELLLYGKGGWSAASFLDRLHFPPTGSDYASSDFFGFIRSQAQQLPGVYSLGELIDASVHYFPLRSNTPLS